MKKLTSIILILFLSLLSSPSWSETLTMDDLVERNDLYYKKFTDVPFTGEIGGETQGKFKNGKRDGKWLSYYMNGQLKWKKNYKDGKRDGLNEWYNKNGQLEMKVNYKDGKKDGLFESYWDNGQLWMKENYKDGKWDGLKEWYDYDGSLEKTETWKNGVKQ